MGYVSHFHSGLYCGYCVRVSFGRPERPPFRIGSRGGAKFGLVCRPVSADDWIDLTPSVPVAPALEPPAGSCVSHSPITLGVGAHPLAPPYLLPYPLKEAPFLSAHAQAVVSVRF